MVNMKKITTRTNILNLIAIMYIILGIVFSKVLAAEIEIVDVRRNITLANEDKVYKDYYLNAGESSSLRKNLIVKATRKITVKNPAQKVIGDFKTTVGLLKIIHVEGGVAVAREVSLTPRDEDPMLEQIGIMLGDQVDLKDSYIDNKKK